MRFFFIGEVLGNCEDCGVSATVKVVSASYFHCGSPEHKLPEAPRVRIEVVN
jgi:hypothetical protein